MKVRRLLDKQIAKHKSNRGEQVEEAAELGVRLLMALVRPSVFTSRRPYPRTRTISLGEVAGLVRLVNMTDDNCPSMRK